MSGLNIQRLRDIFDDVYDSLTGTLKTGGAQTIVLGIFRATGAGTGYSIDDIIVLRQTPPDAAEYFNVTTGAVIATPDPADLGSVSSASVAVTSSALPTGASTSALQSAVQADAGSDASKAIAVQGVTNGKAITVSAGTNLNTSALALESGGNLAEIADATGTDGGATPSRVVLIGGQHDSTIQTLKVDAQGRILLSPTDQQTKADSLSVTIASDQGNLGSIANLPASLGIATAANSLSIAPASNAIFVQRSTAFRSSASLTRAANTTTYGVNDVIFGAFELANIGNNGGFIAITDIRFLMNITYLPSGIGNLRLFLYSVTPPSAVADNGAFSVPSGDRASLLTPSGISLGTPALALGGGSLVLSLVKINQFFRLTGTSLFGYLVTEGAWVPTANSETATLTVIAVEV